MKNYVLMITLLILLELCSIIHSATNTVYVTNTDVQTFEKYSSLESAKSAKAVIDLNNEIKKEGILFAITAYLMTTDNIEFALFQKLSTNEYQLKYKYSLVINGNMLFKRQEFYISPCFRVYPGYLVGFILPAGSSPLGYRFDSNRLTYITNTNEGLDINSIIQTDNLKMPYSFALAASYDVSIEDLQNTTSTTTVKCPIGAKVLPDISVLIKCNLTSNPALEVCPVNVTYIPCSSAEPPTPPVRTEPVTACPACTSHPEALLIPNNTLSASNIIGIFIWLILLTILLIIIIIYLICTRTKTNPVPSTPVPSTTTSDLPPPPGKQNYPNFRVASAYSGHSWVGKFPEDNWTLYKIENSSASVMSGESA